MQPLDAHSVKEWRHRRMLSQQEVADRAGTSLFTIQRIERGEGNVRPKTGRAVATALGVPIEELLPKAQAPLWSDEPPAERRRAEIEAIKRRYRPYRVGLERFCEHWERRLAADDLDRRSLEEFFITAEHWIPTILTEVINSELAELLEAVGGEPRSELLRTSEFWPACERYLRLGEALAKAGENRFGKDVSSEDNVVRLADFRRQLDRRAG